MKFQSSINVTNARERAVMFHLEPWGEQMEMHAAATFTVIAEAEEQGFFEVEHGEDKVTVWAWPSAVVKLFCGGEEIGVCGGVERPAVPPVPEGQSVSSFLRGLLGKEVHVPSEGET